MLEATPLFIVHVLGFAGFLWLGLYALARGDGKDIAAVTGIAALASACFFLSGGLLMALRGGPETVSVHLALNRATWWADVVPVALWLYLSLRLNPAAAQARWRAAVLWTTGVAGALLILFGTATNLVNDYDHVPVSAGPAYGLYAVYVLLCTGFAVVNFVQMRHNTGYALATAGPGYLPTVTAAGDAGALRTGRTTTRAHRLEEQLLVAGGVCFLLGGGYLALKIMLRSSWYELPAYVLLLLGLGAVGATLTLQSALLLGKDIRRDAVYSVTGLAGLLVLYLVLAGVLVGFDTTAHEVFALLLAALITTSHALYDVGRDWLDKVFFTPLVRQERSSARAYEAALAVQPAGPHPDLATAKAFDDAVRRALTHLSDPTKLATSPLLNLTVVAQGVRDQQLEDNRLNRAAVLKEVLLDLLDGLRPADGGGRVTSDAWRYYNCLYYPYVRGIGRRRAPTVLRQLAERRKREGSGRGDLEQVLDWLVQVDEDTFYKWQRRGSDTIAAALREREAALGGALPAASPARARLPNPTPRGAGASR